ncbi:SDR family NAD(P)-dependent oxidoreductase [Streptomyces mirabilis]|uniref:SDR family NAD(P)-dependent oxidoreductase n=1 Tax=Streptomyces mirabilis TaxID=68239 RepID=UPI00369B54A7
MAGPARTNGRRAWRRPFHRFYDIAVVNTQRCHLMSPDVTDGKDRNMEFRDRKALVTGGATGIGFATARLLAREGAEVVIAGRSEEAGAKAAAVLGGRARFLQADLRDPESVRRLVEEASDVDVLVNNAGAFPFAPTAEQGLNAFQQLFETNVQGPFFLTAALAQKMAARGGGSIVNVTTIAAQRGIPGTAAYGSTKAAVESLTRTWAVEFGCLGGPSPDPLVCEGGQRIDTPEEQSWDF